MCEKICTLIVDTGADISVIKENILNPNQHIYPAQKCIINGITEGKTESIGLTYTNIKIDYNKIPANFQVVDKNFPICTDGILGRDFLANYGCNICLKSWLLTFSYKNEHFEIPIEDKFQDHLVIPPRCQVIKQIFIPEIKEDSVVIADQIKPGVFIGNSVINNKIQFINVLNVNSSTRTIPHTFKPKIVPLKDYLLVNPNKQKETSTRSHQLIDELNLSTIPDEGIKSKLKQLCLDFNDIFALKDEPLSANNFYKQTLRLNSDSPTYIKNYRIPEAHKAEMDKQVRKMVDDKIVRPSISPFNSPILIVPKKSNNDEKKWRLVVDFRQLNKTIIADKFPLPRIDEMLDNLGRAKYFTTLDLASGFHQIELNENSKHYTAFSSSSGHYEFNRLPFGLNVSPNSFQRMMTIALSGLPPECAFLYIDDILVVGCSVNHHFKNLETVFKRLRQYNLKLNPAKCNFFKHDVTYLGHHISEKGILPDPSKYNVIKNFPVPKTSDEVRRFVAFCNYYRRFIPKFADIAHPLNKLLRKNAVFEWNEECKTAFETLKRKLISPPVLRFPDFKKNFVLITDASKVACGAILAQSYDNVDLPIAFASKAFTKGESNKSTIEQELTAIHWAVLHFRPYLIGTKFTIKTDHRPLVYLFSMKNPTSKLTRMRLELEEFDYDIQYVQGKTNVGADALSRIQLDSDILKNMTVLKVTTRAMSKKTETQPSVQHNTVKQNSNETDHLNAFESLNNTEIYDLPKLYIERYKNKSYIYKILNKNLKKVLTRESSTQVPNLTNMFEQIEKWAKELNVEKIALALSSTIFEVISVHEFKNQANETLQKLQILLYIPQQDIQDTNIITKIIAENHESAFGGHVGINRLYRKLKTIYKWPNMKATITNYVNQCITCKQHKHTIRTNENFMHTPTPLKSFESIAMDTIGPFPKSNSDNRYALTIQCDLSKYVIVKPIKDKQASTIAKAFIENCILIYGTPSIIRTDQGTEYKNEIFNKISEMLQYTHIFSTPYHPQTIGNLERNHRCLNEYLRQFVNESQTDWDEWIPYYAFCYNTTPCTDIPYTPYELVFGKMATLPNNLKNPTRIEPIYNYDQYYAELKYKLQATAIRTQNIIDKVKNNRNTKQQVTAKPINIEIDDLVMLENPNRNKLDKVYKGPYKVINIAHPNITILDEATNIQHTVHKNRVIKI